MPIARPPACRDALERVGRVLGVGVRAYHRARPAVLGLVGRLAETARVEGDTTVTGTQSLDHLAPAASIGDAGVDQQYVCAAVAGVSLSVILEGGSPAVLFAPPALILIFVGTAGACLAGTTMPGAIGASAPPATIAPAPSLTATR